MNESLCIRMYMYMYLYLFIYSKYIICYVYIYFKYSCCKNIIAERLNEKVENVFQDSQLEEPPSRFANFTKL